MTQETPDELALALRVGAVGSYAAEAAVELLIRHGYWLGRPGFVEACLVPLDAEADTLGVDWMAVVDQVRVSDAAPAHRAVAEIAAQIGVGLDVASTEIVAAELRPLRWLLASLDRGDLDLVLAAIAHAGGTHDQVEHVGAPTPAGEWAATSTSPRVGRGSLHPWPPAAS